MRPMPGSFGALLVVRKIIHDLEAMTMPFRCRFRTMDSDLDCGSLLPLFRSQPAGPGWMGGEREAVCGGSLAFHSLPAAGCGLKSGSRLPQSKDQAHSAFTSVPAWMMRIDCQAAGRMHA
jgi:hypothetical protein